MAKSQVYSKSYIRPAKSPAYLMSLVMSSYKYIIKDHIHLETKKYCIK